MEGVNGFDSAVMGFVQEHCHNAFTDAIFPIITFFGEAGLFWIALSLGLLFFPKTRKCGMLALCAIAAGFLLGELGLKNLVCRPRPCQMFPDYVRLLLPPPDSYSFPSGHTVSSFAVAAVYFRFSKKWGSAALVLAGLIAFSRVFLFFHWPTDVLAGAVFGIGIAWLVLWIAPKIAKKRRETEEELDRG